MEDDTYFVFVNNERQAIQKGQQVYYCYGSRSNRFLLLNYGFCFPGNRYDSYEIHVKMNADVTKPSAKEILDFAPNEDSESLLEMFRFKRDILNEKFMAYLRCVLKYAYFGDSKDESTQEAMKSILLTRPAKIFYEKYVFEQKLQVLNYILTRLEFKSTLEQDLKLLAPDAPPINFELRMAIFYRAEKKKIIRN